MEKEKGEIKTTSVSFLLSPFRPPRANYNFSLTLDKDLCNKNFAVAGFDDSDARRIKIFI
jgi:hypothetical protein